MKQKDFFRIRQKETGLYFNGGRISPSFSTTGIRYEKAQPVTAALRYLELERIRALRVSSGYSDGYGEYWNNLARTLNPENLETVRFRETITEIETIPAR